MIDISFCPKPKVVTHRQLVTTTVWKDCKYQRGQTGGVLDQDGLVAISYVKRASDTLGYSRYYEGTQTEGAEKTVRDDHS